MFLYITEICLLSSPQTILLWNFFLTVYIKYFVLSKSIDEMYTLFINYTVPLIGRFYHNFWESLPAREI